MLDKRELASGIIKFQTLDELLNIDNTCFSSIVNQIYPPELQIYKVNSSDTGAPVLDLHLSRVMRTPVYAICEQQRRRSACASAQSDQHLCCLLPR